MLACENQDRMKRTIVVAAASLLLFLVSPNIGSTAREPAVTANTVTSGATLLPNGRRITPAGRSVALTGDLPLAIVPTQDGSRIVVLTSGFHDHGVTLIDPTTARVVATQPLGKTFAGLVATPSTLLVSGGGLLSKRFADQAIALPPVVANSIDAELQRIAVTGDALTAVGGSRLRYGGSDAAMPRPATSYIGELAMGAGTLFGTDIGTNSVYARTSYESDNDKSLALPVGYRPFALAARGDGGELAVGNWGEGTISLLENIQRAPRVRTTIAVGKHPNALAYAPDGRLFVANGGANTVSVIAHDTVTETIVTSLSANAPIGSTPDALAIASDGSRLYVANADNDDVAVVNIASPGHARVLGFIPTGWYPSALAIAPNGKQLYVGVGKGLGFRGNPTATGLIHRNEPDAAHPFDYIGALLGGAVSIVDVPSETELATMTARVRANNAPHARAPQARAHSASVRATAFRAIDHVVYIIRENRTYDQVLGDLGRGNGDPNLTLFGADVTPNAHALAKRYVTLDNFYASGEVSEDGHQWCDAAYATDFTERAWPNSYARRGEPEADDRLIASPAGYLWANAGRHGKTYRSYGEFAGFKSTPEAPPQMTSVGDLVGHASIPWIKAHKTDDRTDDVANAAIFIADLHASERTGDWPQLTIVSLGEDHTEGLKAGALTPVAHVASNDRALGLIVDAISHSRYWKSTAILVLEDDAQNGPDHVDAHRTVGLVISPYAARDTVDSTFYTTTSFVRTIEDLLRLPPMTQHDTNATPLDASFVATPSFTPFEALAARVDLRARNPMTGAGARASAKLDFSAYDRVDPAVLNAMLWHDRKPGIPLPRSVSMLSR